MRLRRTLRTALAPAIAALLLGGCAGPPDPQEKVAAGKPKHCEHTTGSMLCSNSSEDMPVGDNTSAPGITTPFNGAKGN
jgi:hypothetical protein